MELTSFLQKDMIVFLENSEKFSASDNKMVENELTSVLSQKLDTTNPQAVFNDSQINQSAPVEIKPQINVNISKEDLVKPVLENENTIKTPIEEVVSKQISNPILETPDKPREVEKSKVVEEVKVAKKDEILEEVKAIEEVKERKFGLPKSDLLKKETPTINPLSVPITDQPIKPKISPEPKTVFDEHDEIIIQITELSSLLKENKTLEVLKLYTHLKLLSNSITLPEELDSKLITSLQKTANYLLNKKTLLLKEKTISKLDAHEEEHEKKSDLKLEKNQNVNSDITKQIKSTDYLFLRKEYVNALTALKKGDKVRALELLIPLVKQNPKNISMKRRLREALSL